MYWACISAGALVLEDFIPIGGKSCENEMNPDVEICKCVPATRMCLVPISLEKSMICWSLGLQLICSIKLLYIGPTCIYNHNLLYGKNMQMYGTKGRIGMGCHNPSVPRRLAINEQQSVVCFCIYILLKTCCNQI